MVALRDSQPLIWRRIHVGNDTTLAKLHRVLQCVMGWEDAHLHRFVIEGEYYETLLEDERGSRTTRDERKYTLRTVVPREGWQFVYDYDFGVALVLIDQLWMPLPEHLKFDYVTADLSYLRLLGECKGMELKTNHGTRST
jgi:hypothetical protein